NFPQCIIAEKEKEMEIGSLGSESSLLEDVPLEILTMILLQVTEMDRLRLLRASQRLRNHLLDSATVLPPKTSRLQSTFRRDCSHLFLFGTQLTSASEKTDHPPQNTNVFARFLWKNKKKKQTLSSEEQQQQRWKQIW